MVTKRKPRQGQDRVIISVSPYCHTRLQAMMARLRAETRIHPERYTGYVGRRLTYSDLLNLLYERFHNAESETGT